MSVQIWRRKPPSTEDLATITVARYEPGKPLAGVIQVARMANEGRVAVAYLPAIAGEPPVMLPDTSVLVAAWLDTGEPPTTEYIVVAPGQYLVFEERYNGLAAEDAATLDRWYTLEHEVPA